MREISLTNSNKLALVDDEDWIRTDNFNWNLSPNSGIRRCQRPCIKLSNFIMKEHNKMFDHKNLNMFDNRKENLRECNKSQNKMNNDKYDTFKPASSMYKGVSWNKRAKKWVTRIRANNILYFLGYFQTELEAAVAYNDAAVKYHGEFAKLNVVSKQ